MRDGEPKLAYHTHRAVDEAHEIITATHATSGDVNEAHLLPALIDDHQAHTGQAAETSTSARPARISPVEDAIEPTIPSFTGRARRPAPTVHSEGNALEAKMAERCGDTNAKRIWTTCIAKPGVRPANATEKNVST